MTHLPIIFHQNRSVYLFSFFRTNVSWALQQKTYFFSNPLFVHSKTLKFKFRFHFNQIFCFLLRRNFCRSKESSSRMKKRIPSCFFISNVENATYKQLKNKNSNLIWNSIDVFKRHREKIFKDICMLFYRTQLSLFMNKCKKYYLQWESSKTCKNVNAKMLFFNLQQFELRKKKKNYNST